MNKPVTVTITAPRLLVLTTVLDDGGWQGEDEGPASATITFASRGFVYSLIKASAEQWDDVTWTEQEHTGEG